MTNNSKKTLYVYRLTGAGKTVIGSVKAEHPQRAAALFLDSDDGRMARREFGLDDKTAEAFPVYMAYHSSLRNDSFSLEFFDTEHNTDAQALELRKVFMDAKTPVVISERDDAGKKVVCVCPEIAPEWWLADFSTVHRAKEFCNLSGLTSTLR